MSPSQGPPTAGSAAIPHGYTKASPTWPIVRTYVGVVDAATACTCPASPATDAATAQSPIAQATTQWRRTCPAVTVMSEFPSFPCPGRGVDTTSRLSLSHAWCPHHAVCQSSVRRQHQDAVVPHIREVHGVAVERDIKRVDHRIIRRCRDPHACLGGTEDEVARCVHRNDPVGGGV